MENIEYQPGSNLGFEEFIELHKEDQKIKAEQIKILVGENANEEDVNAAKELIEEGYLEPKTMYERLALGLIVVKAPSQDKNTGIAIDTANSKIFKLFNNAANTVLKSYFGFFQTGSKEASGYAEWELWKLPDNISPFKIVEDVYQKMQELDSTS